MTQTTAISSAATTNSARMWGLHRPGNDPTRAEVLHGGQIQPALAGLDLLDVGSPHAVSRVGAELAADEVPEGLHALHRHGAALAVAPMRALQGPLSASAARRASRPPGSPHGPAWRARAGCHSSASSPHERRGCAHQPRVIQRPVRRRPPDPRPVPGLRDAEQLALQGDRQPLGLLGFRDEPVDADRVPVSRAKKAVACLRMSRSCSRRRTRFLSSRSSSRSALVSPLSRSPRSRSPWRRQSRSVCGETPRLSATSAIERP